MTQKVRNKIVFVIFLLSACGVSEHSSSPVMTDALNEEPTVEKYVDCKPIQELLPPSRCEYFKNIWDGLEQGWGAISHPDAVQRGEVATITLVLGKADSFDSLTGTLEDMLGRKPDQKFKLRVGRRMAARLRGDGYDIEPQNPEIQDLYLGMGETWDWKIKALKNPRHTLYLSTYAVVPSPDGLKQSLLRTVEIQIPIHVTLVQKLGDLADSLSIFEKILIGISSIFGTLGGLYLIVKNNLVKLIAGKVRLRKMLNSAFK